MPPPGRPAHIAAPMHLYGSGDAGTKALIELLLAKDVYFVLHDIRHRSADMKRASLARLGDLGLRTVPQLFDRDDQLIGNFEASATHIAGMPAPDLVDPMAA